MKRILISIVAGLVSATITWAAGINYNGTNLQENTEFTRTQCGTAYKDVMTEMRPRLFPYDTRLSLGTRR